eukprot:GHVH01010842.1.p1 GENE.GHVH01010842.1~~GHVH01010842.1.p1  ORF type:complete len:397 (+),score=49.79 GHVH01010842.1:25-1191(+)
MQKKSPWLRGNYTGLVSEESKGPSVVVKGGLDSTIVRAAEITVGEKNIPFNICTANEKGIKRANEDIILLVPSLRAHLKSLSLNALATSGLDKRDSSGERITLPLGSDVSLIGILDGHGGRKVAEFVHSELPALIALRLTDGDWAGSLEDTNLAGEMLADVFLNLDRRLISQVPNSVREGTTVCLLMVPLEMSRSRMFCANVGDSQCFLHRLGTVSNLMGHLHYDDIDEDGPEVHSIEVSTLHKPFSACEKERIHANDATIERGRVNGSLDVSRSLGDHDFKKFGVSAVPSVSFVDFEPSRDLFFCLFSDGLNVLGDGQRICQKLSTVTTTCLKQMLLDCQVSPGTETAVPQVLSAACKSVIDEAVTDYKCRDNCSLIVIHPQQKRIV